MPCARLTMVCGTEFVTNMAKMESRGLTFKIDHFRCTAGLEPDHMWRICGYMATPRSTIPGFVKLAKELRTGELWRYHILHPDIPDTVVHPTRSMCSYALYYR